jgi:hypothetical protein
MGCPHRSPRPEVATRLTPKSDSGGRGEGSLREPAFGPALPTAVAGLAVTHPNHPRPRLRRSRPAPGNNRDSRGCASARHSPSPVRSRKGHTRSSDHPLAAESVATPDTQLSVNVVQVAGAWRLATASLTLGYQVAVSRESVRHRYHPEATSRTSVLHNVGKSKIQSPQLGPPSQISIVSYLIQYHSCRIGICRQASPNTSLLK